MERFSKQCPGTAGSYTISIHQDDVVAGQALLRQMVWDCHPGHCALEKGEEETPFVSAWAIFKEDLCGKSKQKEVRRVFSILKLSTSGPWTAFLGHFQITISADWKHRLSLGLSQPLTDSFAVSGEFSKQLQLWYKEDKTTWMSMRLGKMKHPTVLWLVKKRHQNKAFTPGAPYCDNSLQWTKICCNGNLFSELQRDSFKLWIALFSSVT